MSLRGYAATAGGALVLGALGGLALGWRLYHPTTPPPAPDRPAAAIPLPGGAVVAPVVPKASLPSVPGLPSGWRPVRRVEATIQPTPRPQDGPAIADGYATDAPPPVKVTVEFVQAPNGALRAVVKAENGTVLATQDTPLMAQPVHVDGPTVKPTRWIVSAYRAVPLDIHLAPTWGAEVQYAKGPFVVGAGGDRYEARASFGIRF